MDDGSLAASPFDRLTGARFVELSPDRVVAELGVTPELHQVAGILHGGVHCSLVESVASTGAYLWLVANVDADGRVVGMSNRTDFLKAVSTGTLTATGVPVHRGRSTQLWDVTIVNERDDRVARGSVQLMNLRSSGR